MSTRVKTEKKDADALSIAPIRDLPENGVIIFIYSVLSKAVPHLQINTGEKEGKRDTSGHNRTPPGERAHTVSPTMEKSDRIEERPEYL